MTLSIRRGAIATFAGLALTGQSAPESDPPGNGAATPATAEEAFAAANAAYGPAEPEPEVAVDCQDPAPGEIVVCAALEEQSQFRVPSRLDQGDDSHLSWDGDPPDVAGPGIFRGKATASGCIKGVTCPPPPAYIFDITALPEAPPGSDADKIAKGERPE
ncbi:hypothetical protein WAB17_06860 [Parerythrobacter aurantius]|uniref:hypothetical protein n=1 Tax=Parerythrobacter aurantius TaxID=3127706 RepID=UPI003243B3E6